jgi:uncharacterized protein YndB with AHSA1/START domain
MTNPSAALSDSAAPGASTGAGPKLEYERVVEAPVEDVWRALTDTDEVERYFFDAGVECSWMPGSPVTWLGADGEPVIRGEVLDIDEPNRLVHTFAFTAASDAGAAAAADAPTTVTWLLETEDEGTRLSLVHDGFAGETTTWRSVEDGWEQVLDGLVLLFQDEV